MPHCQAPSLLLNPDAGAAGTGVALLERCFASPWSAAMYHWYLQRAFAGVAPDRLVLIDGTEAVAGCGIAYRFLRTPDGRIYNVGVVLAAGTVPNERGRGHYTRVLQAAVERIAARGCEALLGFVTADNA